MFVCVREWGKKENYEQEFCTQGSPNPSPANETAEGIKAEQIAWVGTHTLTLTGCLAGLSHPVLVVKAVLIFMSRTAAVSEAVLNEHSDLDPIHGVSPYPIQECDFKASLSLSHSFSLTQHTLFLHFLSPNLSSVHPFFPDYADL